MIPHQLPDSTVHPVASQNHAAVLDSPIHHADFDAFGGLDDSDDLPACPYAGLIREGVVQNLQEFASL